ncbi:unnamed protein product [Mortierella alpina]
MTTLGNIDVDSDVAVVETSFDWQDSQSPRQVEDLLLFAPCDPARTVSSMSAKSTGGGVPFLLAPSAARDGELIQDDFVAADWEQEEVKLTSRAVVLLAEGSEAEMVDGPSGEVV